MTGGTDLFAETALPGDSGDRPAETELRVLQRVVFPGDDLDIVPLYVETNPERGAGELASELAVEAQTGKKATAVSAPVASAAVARRSTSSSSVPRWPPRSATARNPGAAR